MQIKIFRNWIIIGILLLIFASGCANLGQVQKYEVTPVVTEELPPGNGWWRARFRMDWPPDTEPIWYMDLYIAHQVILPLLELNKADIYLWRFHRRAKRDGAGRQFSFIFYSSPQTAQRIFSSLQSNFILTEALASGVIDDIVYDDPAEIRKPDIDDTSDKSWPAVIQKSWPYYITGVSQMWLNLVAAIAERDLKEGHRLVSFEEIETIYSGVDESITELWRINGRHAFLHHLNAVFGYHALIYYEKLYLNF